jgi:hypothetical protein
MYETPHFTRAILYVASPYSHPDPKVQHGRFVDVCRATAHLINQGWLAYSPISQTVPVAEYGAPGKTTWADWESYDRRFLKRCMGLAVLKLDGWRESVGVQAEIAYAKELGLLLYSIDPQTFEVSFEI